MLSCRWSNLDPNRVEKVQLLVDGEKIVLNYGTSLNEYYLRPLIINPLS